MRRCRGSLLIKLVNSIWKDPNSTKIRFLMDVLNQADPTHFSNQGHATKLCENCGLNAEATTYHRIVGCPAMADLWNNLDEAISEVIGPTYPKTNPRISVDKKIVKQLKYKEKITFLRYSYRVNQ